MRVLSATDKHWRSNEKAVHCGRNKSSLSMPREGQMTAITLLFKVNSIICMAYLVILWLSRDKTHIKVHIQEARKALPRTAYKPFNITHCTHTHKIIAQETSVKKKKKRRQKLQAPVQVVKFQEKLKHTAEDHTNANTETV